MIAFSRISDAFSGLFSTNSGYLDSYAKAYTATQPVNTYTTITTYNRKPSYHPARPGKRWK